jgi:UDP-N-acetylglucosamine 2-epimerase (non-hydrolysing)
MLIHFIVAARPNFMKVAPLYHAFQKESWASSCIVHTGQHYDVNMSDAFLQDFALPEPDFHLGVGSGSHAEQTGHVMIRYEKLLMERRPDLVIVVGDVNSTMAATLTAVKLGIKVAHLEAGLRCFDRTMPEEINRLVTDAMADLLWTPSTDADRNLIREGISSKRIHRVGNIMIDSLEMLRKKIESCTAYEDLNLQEGEYGLVTLHRPSNVDAPNVLKMLCEVLIRIAERIPLVFPIHPRTRRNLERGRLMSFLAGSGGLILLEPLNYVRFMNLVFNCRLVITDSGGIQEETTYLGIPCLTMRPNTERPITVYQGTNQLCRAGNLENRVKEILSERTSQPSKIELWDGQTASRVVESTKSLHLI